MRWRGDPYGDLNSVQGKAVREPKCLSDRLSKISRSNMARKSLRSQSPEEDSICLKVRMPAKQIHHIWLFRGGSLWNLLESFNTFRRRCRKFSLTQRNSKNNNNISSVGRKALWCIFVKSRVSYCQDKGCCGLAKIGNVF